MTQQQKEERKANARRQRQQIAVDVLRAQVANKKERHAGHAGGNGYEVTRPKLLFVEQRLENQHVNRRRILQKDRIGGSRQLRGKNE